MDVREFYDTLVEAEKLESVQDALSTFKHSSQLEEIPFGGRPNNRGAIEVASDPTRSIIERVTNAQDAILEREFSLRAGRPICRSPREAAEAWLSIPRKDGLSGLTPKARQDLALDTIVRLESGEGWPSRIITVIDKGIGILPERMAETILSLNESNKIQKHYLAGTYGQGGSSTLGFSKFVFFASRIKSASEIAFTVARYEDLPADRFKTGRYVYLVNQGKIITINAEPKDFEYGTIVRHFGYDLSNYTSSIGPKSLYGALQRVLFDPIAPIRFENRVAGWNRTIKGSRNALNGAVDQGDDNSRGPDLDYHLPMFSVSLGDHGDIGIEYWVLSKPASKDGKKASGKPSRSFVDDTKPIILTHNGQNQGELSGKLIKKDADLPFLQAQGRLVVHINCDRLSSSAKRLLFSSTREQSREGIVQSEIQGELIELLKSDDELKRLNERARDESLKEKDDAAEKQMQRQVAKLLKLFGPTNIEAAGAGDAGVTVPGTRKPRPPRKPEPIIPNEPPTYIKILVDKDRDLTFFAKQRRYLRIETDANSHYHDPDDPQKSSINIAVSDDLKVFGTSPLRGGRMRVGIQCLSDVALGTKGEIRVELYRSGKSTLSDQCSYLIVQQPRPEGAEKKTPFPQFKIVPVDGPNDESWEFVTDDANDGDSQRHASAAKMNEGVLYVYYSTHFPRFVSELKRVEQQNPAMVASFQKRYELWITVHALLSHQDAESSDEEMDDEILARELSRQERCRLASIAAMFAIQEVITGANVEDGEDLS